MITPDTGSRLRPAGSGGLTQDDEMVPPPLLRALGWMAVLTVYWVGVVAYANAVGAGSRTAIATVQLALPPELVAVMVYAAAGLTTVGVPLMIPEAGSSARPPGSAGDTVQATTA